jgi:cyclopropane fatty-acyl-phospholipid synthase-like methyltransferase
MRPARRLWTLSRPRDVLATHAGSGEFMAIAPRHSAAVSALALKGDESVLEIGCGHGVAVRLVLDELTTGTITALDRSQKMIDMVAVAAPEALAAGRLHLRAEALEKADFAEERFDAIFAINVDLNLRLGTRWPGLIKALLKPGGRVVLAFDPPPDSSKGHALVGKSLDRLVAAGFTAALLPAHGKVTIISADLA